MRVRCGRTLPIQGAKLAEVVREVGTGNAVESAQSVLEPALVGVDGLDVPWAAHALALGPVDWLVLDVERLGGACQQAAAVGAQQGVGGHRASQHRFVYVLQRRRQQHEVRRLAGPGAQYQVRNQLARDAALARLAPAMPARPPSGGQRLTLALGKRSANPSPSSQVSSLLRRQYNPGCVAMVPATGSLSQVMAETVLPSSLVASVTS